MAGLQRLFAGAGAFDRAGDYAAAFRPAGPERAGLAFVPVSQEAWSLRGILVNAKGPGPELLHEKVLVLDDTSLRCVEAASG
ncbi:MAG: hypothetical protein ACYS1C_06630, partial [Planctomycetota bacterium]